MKNLILAGVLIFSAAVLTDAQNMKKNPMLENPAMLTQPAMNLALEMRRLWEDHIGYTHQYVVAAVAGTGDTTAVAERLLKNQEQIGSALKPYYGDDASKALTTLLKEHITIATQVVAAAKAGTEGRLNAASESWTANADSIAAFLSRANPKWSRNEIADMLHRHLDLLGEQVNARLTKDWKKDIEAADQGHLHMLTFADVLTEGVVEQFPNRFTAEGRRAAR